MPLIPRIPSLGLRRRVLLLAFLPAMLTLAWLVWINHGRAQTLLMGFANDVLVNRAQTIASRIEAAALETFTATKVTTASAQGGLFGRRLDSLRLARDVLQSNPQLTTVSIAYEPGADGLDERSAAARSATEPAPGTEVRLPRSTPTTDPTTEQAISRLPRECLGPDGRFLPSWNRSSSAPKRITLAPLALGSGSAYEECRSRFADQTQPTKAIVAGPLDSTPPLAVGVTMPIVIDGRFMGAVSIQRSLEPLRQELLSMQKSMRDAGWNVEIALVNRQGTVIASTAGTVAAAPVESPYADILSRFSTPGAMAGTTQNRDPLTGVDSLYGIAKAPTAAWHVLVKMPSGDIASRLYNTLVRNSGWSLVSMAVVLGLLVWLASSFTRRIGTAIAAAERVADGDLSGRIEDRGNDETGRLLRGLGGMMGSLRSRIASVKQSSVDLMSTAEQLTEAGSVQEAAISSLGASTSEAAVASRQISVTGRELLNTVNEVAGVAADTAHVADAGRQNLTGVGETMQKLKSTAAEFTERLSVIRERAEDINLVITTITKVADQTNLLSINAAIEAEKAGEYGQGFIVVAREIRRLADQTAVATLDIERLVAQMQQAVGAGVMEMDRFSSEFNTGMEQVAGISSQFVEVIDKVQVLTTKFEHVNQGMHAQATGAQQITEALITITDGSRTAAESLRDFKQASQHIVRAVEGLAETVDTFRLEDAV